MVNLKDKDHNSKDMDIQGILKEVVLDHQVHLVTIQPDFQVTDLQVTDPQVTDLQVTDLQVTDLLAITDFNKDLGIKTLEAPTEVNQEESMP